MSAADPGRPAVIDEAGNAWSHGQLVDRAEGAAAGLLRLGLRPGDHLGLFLPNRATWLVAALAGARAGIGILGLNTRFREVELNHLLTRADVDTVVVADAFLGIDAPALMSRLDRPPRLVVDGPACPAGAEPWHEVETAGPPVDLSPSPDAPLIGFTTSGTTGFPKIAMHTMGQTRAHLRAVVERFGLGPHTVSLVPLPVCGAFGYTVAMATVLAGGAVVVHETWDPDRAAAAVSEHGVTFLNASDDMLLALAASPAFQAETTWRTGGFADFTNAGARAVADIERITGGRTRLAGLYGSSEGFALMASWPHDGPADQRSANGGHLVGIDMAVRACDPDGEGGGEGDAGRPLPHGQPGELHFRGPNLITGYLNDPAATERAFTDDGWYRSGDLGHTVEPDAGGHQGFVYLARLGDSLRLRGFLCDPAEIETHLERHPAVDLAQVVGVARPGRGDVAVAFVRLDTEVGTDTDTSPIDEATLVEHCRRGLANYKRPERIVTIDEFPVTDGPNGVKIRKVELRQRAAALLDGGP